MEKLLPSLPKKERHVNFCFNKNILKIIRKLSSYLQVVNAKNKATNHGQVPFLKLNIFFSVNIFFQLSMN